MSGNTAKRFYIFASQIIQKKSGEIHNTKTKFIIQEKSGCKTLHKVSSPFFTA
jgi:hypothetical protein